LNSLLSLYINTIIINNLYLVGLNIRVQFKFTTKVSIIVHLTRVPSNYYRLITKHKCFYHSDFLQYKTAPET